jgi:cytochrome c peroxidase
MSCGTCHQPEKAFTDGLPKARGKLGQTLSRKTMSLYNIADDSFYFWDGRAKTLEEQFKIALQNTEEMDFSFKEAIKIINTNKDYQKLLLQANISFATEELITNSIVAYVRSIKAPRSRFDDWLDGDNTALSYNELKGFEVFNNKANCIACHFGNHFTDGLRNDIGLADKDLGYGSITKNPDDNHMFKTVNLRDIKNRSPYMHNGSLKTLEEVITHYNDGGFKRSATDIPDETNQPDDMAFHNFTQPLNLDDKEKKYLIDFLKTL